MATTAPPKPKPTTRKKSSAVNGTAPPPTGMTLGDGPMEFIDPETGFRFRPELVDLSKTFVDEDYQRPLTSFVDKIKDKLRPALLGTLIVSERARGNHPAKTPYAVVDGQTRREGLIHHQWTHALALVYTGLSKADEASLFSDLQRERRNIATFYRFRAALVAGDPEAVNIQRILEQNGYTAGPNAGKEGNAISAIANLEKLYRRSPELLERTLGIYKESWQARYVPNGDLLGGMGWFLEQMPNADDETLARRLSIRSPDEMRRKASAMREGVSHSGALSKYMGMVIEGVYRSRAGGK